MANKPNSQPKQPNAPVTVAKEAGTEAPRSIKRPGDSKRKNVLRPAKSEDTLMGVQRERR
jgi:hypothetical protein